MKKNLLLLFVCLFGALGGVKAYTTTDLTAAGWSKVSAISNDANNDNYVGKFVYVLVDAGSSNFVLSGQTVEHPWGGGRYTPSYRTLDNPFKNKYDVWTLEVRNDGFAMCNVETKDYYNSTDPTNPDGNYDGCWNKMATDFYTYGSFAFNKSEDKYNINGVQATSGYVGPWSGTVSNAGATAANKEGAAAPGFEIYRMAKATYLLNYLKQVPNLTSPVDASYLIVNPTIYQGGAATDLPWGWDNTGDYVTGDQKYTDDTGNTQLRAYRKKAGSRTLIFNYNQEISDLPEGQYRVKADCYGTYDRIMPYLYIDAASEEYCEVNSNSSTTFVTNYNPVENSASAKIGLRANGEWYSTTSRAVEAFGDNFRLETDPYLSTMATDLPDDGAMTAGLWYHFKVDNTGNHILTATNLSNIIYATGSTTALSAAGSDKFTAIQTLSANTDYYIRSSSNNTLTITPSISAVAEELPDNGAMTAGNWFYFDVATAGHYDVVATSLANIVYTTDGNLVKDAIVENHFAVKNNDLSATRYYVKSSSAQTLQWFLTDQQNYNSRMSDVAGNWTAAQGTKKEYTKDNQKGVETYNGNNNDFTAGNILYQTINDLPNGNYEVTFWAWENFAPWDKDSNPHPTGDNIAQVFANDAAYGITVIEAYDDRDWNDANKYTLNCHVTNGTLTYGVKNIATGGNWAVCRPISLTYTGPYNEVVESGETQTYEGTFTEDVDFTPTAECPIVDITGASFTGNIDVSFAENPNGLIIATSAQKMELNYLKEEPVKNIISTKDNLSDKVVITDGYPFVAPFDFQAQEARYSRTVGASTNFGTICVPFALTSNEDIQYYTTDRITGGVLKLTEVDNVAAGTPAIFKKKNSGATSISVRTIGTAIEKDAGSQGESVRLVGKFERYVVGDEGGTTGTAANGNYFISSDVFYEGADYIIVKPFRAYLETVGVSQSRLTLQIDDETTAINELKTLDEKQGLKDGKYLIGGRIIVVKEGQQFNVNGVINK